MKGGEGSKGTFTHKRPPLHRYGNGTEQQKLCFPTPFAVSVFNVPIRSNVARVLSDKNILLLLLSDQAFTPCEQESQQTNQSSQRDTGDSNRDIHKGFQMGNLCAAHSSRRFRCPDNPGVQFGAVGEGNDQFAVFIDGNAGDTNAVLALYFAEIVLGAIGEGDNQLAIFVELDVGNSTPSAPFLPFLPFAPFVPAP